MNKLIYICVAALCLLFSGVGSAATWNSSYEEKLIHYFSFDQGNTTNAIDYMGKANGTIVYEGDPLRISGKLGNAFRFDRNPGYNISFSNALFRTLNRNFTVNFWINLTDTGNSATLYPTVFRNGISGNEFSFGCRESGYCAVFDEGTAEYGQWIGIPQYSRWHMLTIVVNQTAINHYYDGVLNYSVALSANFIPPLATATIGGWNTTSGINATIDEFGIWNRTLSPSEILDTYNSGGGISPLFSTGFPIITTYASDSVYSGFETIFMINVTTNTSTNVYANLIYNDTNVGYTSRNVINSNTTSITKTYSIPSSFGNITGMSIPWYWNITTINTTSSYYNQTVRTLNTNIDNCTVYNQTLFNFTLYDENTRSIISAPNISTSMEANLYDSNNILISSSNTTGNRTKFSLCTAPGWLATNITNNLYLSITYYAGGYFNEYYTLHNFVVGNTTIPQDVRLYLLDSTDTTKYKPYTINVKDASLNVISNAIVEIYRYYPGTAQTLLVESQVTDELGNTAGHLTLTDVEYKIIIKKDGQTLYTFSKIRVYETSTCNSIYSDCKLNLQLGEGTIKFNNYNAFLGIYSNYSYSRATKTATISFSSSDTLTKTVTLNGSDYFTRKQICYSSSTSLSDTINCALPANHNGTVRFQVKVNDKHYFNDVVIVKYDGTTSDIKQLRYLFMALLLPILVIMGASSAGISLIFLAIGVLLLLATGFLSGNGFTGGASIFVWVIVGIVILVLKVRSGGSSNG